MDYQRIYLEFIADRKRKEASLTGYSESHHIKPRCHGGSDCKSNLINLTPEDHYFAHLLLAKIYGGGLWFALKLMSGTEDRAQRSKRALRITYGIARREISQNLMGDGNPFFGKSHSEETLEALRCQKIYSFSHKDGGAAQGNQAALRELTGLSVSKVSAVALGTRATAKGWFNSNYFEQYPTEGDLCRQAWASRQEDITLYHHDGRVWTGKPVYAPCDLHTFTFAKSSHGWHQSKDLALRFEGRMTRRGKVAADSRGCIRGANNPAAGMDRRHVYEIEALHKDGRKFRGTTLELFHFAGGGSRGVYSSAIKTFKGTRKVKGHVVKSWRGWKCLNLTFLDEAHRLNDKEAA